MQRRHFLAAATALGSFAKAQENPPSNSKDEQPESASEKPPEKIGFQPKSANGLGGVAIGNGLKPTTDVEAQGALQAAWDSGVRHFDTAPFYGFGLSERRFGQFLSGKDPESYTLSTKVGRLLTPSMNPDPGLWTKVPHFKPVVDYSASATRRSIEDSLQRLGVYSIDIAYIHDLSPDFFGDEWEEKFAEAEKGAIPELQKMKDEGLIKAWGFGVNTLPPLLKCLEVANPDVFLSACQYSLVHHEEALEKLFPKCEEKNVSLVNGAPLNFGFLSGRDRYNYGKTIPGNMLTRREKIQEVCRKHAVELRSAALQFSAYPAVMCATIPGARNASQARANVESMSAKIPADFWKELKSEGLIAPNAPVPA